MLKQSPWWSRREGSPLAVSKVTKKFQATIPQPVRELLGLHQGDRVAFDIKDGQVMLKKLPTLDWEYLEAVSAGLSEWTSQEDEDAYGDL